MKRLLLMALLTCLILTGVMAETPDYFTFTLGTMGGYNFVGAAITAGTVFGIDYNFTETFTGGFKFISLSAGDISTINISAVLAENVAVTLYTGTDNGFNIIFGTGIGYTFFTKKNALFSSMGISIDWLAGSAGNFLVTDGGIITFGLKTRIGI